MDFNPLDYASQFTFMDGDDVAILVEQMDNPANWMISRGTQVLTVDDIWIPFKDHDPGNTVDVALIAYDRDIALTTAHRKAVGSHTRPSKEG